MLGKERTVVGGALVILLIAALGLFIHVDPRFPGSLIGSITGALALLLFLAPLIYGVMKRTPFLRRWSGRVFGARQMIVWHIYTSLAATALALILAAHRFDSILGAVLIALLVVALASGYAGRHYYGQVARDVREKQADLAHLKSRYNELAAEACLCAAPSGPFSTVRALSGGGELGRIASLVGTIADTEQSIMRHDHIKAWLGLWLWVHIVSSYAAFALMFSHLAIEMYLGFRWL